MILKIKPVQFLKGTITLPASKSYSIRASMIAACGGKFTIKNFSDCDDAKVASQTANDLIKGSKIFHVGESGTTLRFLLPLLSLHTKSAVVKGRGTLVGRPNAHLCESLRAQGMNIRGSGPQESVPIVYKGGELKGGFIKIDGSLSSQFISALLIALPRLKKDSRLEITGHEMVSKDYITMTIQILAKAGIKISEQRRGFYIEGNQKFKGLKNFTVPSDYGLAAFPMAAACLLPSQVTLKGHLEGDPSTRPSGSLRMTSGHLIQSDGHILEFLKRMGVAFKKTATAITMSGPFPLKGGVFSLKDCPDLVPMMAVLALFAKGQTHLVHIYHARLKESDRISDLRKELLKIDADVKEAKGALVITPRTFYRAGQLLDSHHDHRLAMAFTVLGLKIGCRVKGIESCRKSYPGFVKDMKLLGL